MTEIVRVSPISKSAFAPYGEVLDTEGDADKIINQGLCERYHDRATLDFGPDGRAGVSLFLAQRRMLPLTLEMVERHPEGSQTFIPMTEHPFLVIVAPDQGGKPGTPLAFLTRPHQGISFHRGTWHGVLTPLEDPGLFAVIDRIGTSRNLEEFWFEAPYVVRNS
ncbi:ureidoglycolate lyase [Actibacterium sp.]|uniref:ureidoglycolate lyase n=1 Tax=Actibacterium sp. TaxID=1872125 RepID=UPI00356933C4